MTIADGNMMAYRGRGLQHVPMASISLQGKQAQARHEYEWLSLIPFVAVHLAAFGALWTGARWQDWTCCALLFWARMFGVTGGYHRYFSHRTYKTSRVGQFLLAFLAQSSSQRGVLWWAAHHRRHHLHSDTVRDVHSPKQWGFWHAHVGWLYDNNNATDMRRVQDLSVYPELRWLDRNWLVPPVVLGFAVWLLLGWSGLWIGFMLSTVITWHSTFTINSLTHLIGKRRYDTPDDSRNHWFLALLTMGEGWHNNHHHYKDCARQGFHWWQIDLTYGILRTLAWFGLVWDIQEPPRHVVDSSSQAKPPRAEPAHVKPWPAVWPASSLPLSASLPAAPARAAESQSSDAC